MDLSSLRKEVREFLRCSEHLLGAAINPSDPALANDEKKLIRYYIAELVQVVGEPEDTDTVQAG